MNISSALEEEDAARKAYWDKKGNGDHNGKSCPNCGRVRVIQYEDGEEICEKCNWNLKANEYETSPYYLY